MANTQSNTTKSVVLDTHSLLWSLFDTALLSRAAVAAISDAQAAPDPIIISSITFIELLYLTEKGRFPPDVYHGCLAAVDDSATVFQLVDVARPVVNHLAAIPRTTVPDMPDRVIAATAFAFGLPLVSRDTEIRKLTNISIIW